MSELDLLLVQQRVSKHMNSITSYFKDGVKITVLVRSAGNPDRDFVMTNDALPEAITALERREREAILNRERAANA